METAKTDKCFYYTWENVLGVKTQLLKVDAEKTVDEIPKKKRLIVIIPGNPGCIQFYEEFAVALWENLDRKTAIWGISHAGHVFHSELSKESFGGATYASLQFQVDHKRSFLQEKIPSDVEEIILIGHSIGAYISLQTAAEDQKNNQIIKITQIIGLFPTIERMALTPRGRICTPVIKYGRWALYFVVAVFSSLPEFFQRSFLRSSFLNLTGHLYEGAKNLGILPSFRNCVLMTRDEMEEVGPLNERLFKQGERKITLYYGSDDHWCPVDFHRDILESFPGGDFRLCQKGFQHAFVMEQAVPMAEMVASWLR